MPEGDSVLQLSERMQWMSGRTITRSDIRVPRFATENLAGRTVTDVWPYGKHLFIDFSGRVLPHPPEDGGRLVDPHRRHPVAAPGHTARTVLRFAHSTRGGPEIEVVGHSWASSGSSTGQNTTKWSGTLVGHPRPRLGRCDFRAVSPR